MSGTYGRIRPAPLCISHKGTAFGKITITPYVAGFDAVTTKLLETKLNRIVSENEAVGGFDKHDMGLVPVIS